LWQVANRGSTEKRLKNGGKDYRFILLAEYQKPKSKSTIM
jgi:hypothetical protein